MSSYAKLSTYGSTTEYFEDVSNAVVAPTPPPKPSTMNLGFFGLEPSLFPSPQPAKVSDGPYVVPAYSSKINLTYTR